MKRFAKSMQGVTLLEIMLVLAIAAMIIVMSIRYYQSATASQQATALLSEIQAITAAGDNLGQGSTGYAAVTQTNVQNLMNNGQTLLSPWGSAITVGQGSGSGASATTYSVSIENATGAVCSNVTTQLSQNTRYTSIAPTTCAATGNTISYTYDAAK